MLLQKKKRKQEDNSHKMVAMMAPRSHVAEQFRTLRTNINFSSPDNEIRSLVITSASPAEGKSTTAANLAIVFAQEGKRVLLIDGDMRRPTLHTIFQMQNAVGLSSILTNRCTLEVALKPTAIDGLDLMTCGAIPPNPAELLSSQSMKTLFQELKTFYDLVIFDTPPILSVTDAQILANRCDGSVLVANSGTTDKKDLVKATGVITAANNKLIGVVLNNLVLPKDNVYYQY